MSAIANLAQLAGVSTTELFVIICAALAAGVVRGFAGFGLSAILMASIALIIPPIELIPICYLLEGTASLVMFRGGLKDADMKIVWGLVIGGLIGLPIGLLVTTGVDVELSKLLALILILLLTFAQFMKFKPKFLATRAGLYLSGITAGIATGIASIGGMVVALYVLASNAEPKKMRASLVMYLCIGMFTSLFYYLGYGIMTKDALVRGLILAPLIVIGVGIGSLLFRPQYEYLYKRSCLTLLALLSFAGIVRLINF